METLELTVRIVRAQVKCARLTSDETVSYIQSVYDQLIDLEKEETVATRITNFSSPLDSIRREEVICLECGGKFKLLSTRHLALHGLTPRTYKQKHGLPLKQPLSAQSLTARRRRIAKANGWVRSWQRGETIINRIWDMGYDNYTPSQGDAS